MRYHIQLIGMALLWGAAWSFAQVVLKYVPPLTAAGLRFFIASVFLLGWLIYHEGFRGIKALSPAQWSSLTLAGAVGVAGYSVFFMYALQYVPAGKASTIVSLNPVPILILGVIFFHERINWGICCGMLVAVLGSMIAISQGNPLDAFAGGAKVGTFLLLCTIACWTAYTFIARAWLGGISPLVVTLVTSIVGAILLSFAGLMVEGLNAWYQVAHAPAQMWLSMLGLSIGAAALAYLWYFAGVQALGVGVPATYMVLVPVFGILISALWLGEPITVSLMLGAVMVVGGMLLMNWSKRFID